MCINYFADLSCTEAPEPEYVNVKGAEESILRNRFRQPIEPGGPVRQPYLTNRPEQARQAT